MAIKILMGVGSIVALLYGYIAEPRAHERWSPFMKMDPAQQNTYTGLAALKTLAESGNAAQSRGPQS
jgi:hypothetical protein